MGRRWRSDWAPRTASPPGTESHCPFASPGEEVAGWSGGDTPAALGKPPQALPVKYVSGAGGGAQADRDAHYPPPCLLPTAPEQRRLRQPLPAESREEVVLSHPGLCHFSETTPPNIPAPGGEHGPGQAPEGGSSGDGGQMHHSLAVEGVPDLRFMFVWVVLRPWGTQAPGNRSWPPPAAVTPPLQPLPRPGQINIYLEKAKVRTRICPGIPPTRTRCLSGLAGKGPEVDLQYSILNQLENLRVGKRCEVRAM